MVPTKLQVVFLTSLYYIKLKGPVDIIFLPSACEAYTNTFYLPTRNSLSKEVDSRKIGSRFTNFTLEYKDIYDFALIKGLQIPNLTTDELTKLTTEIPKMKGVTMQYLNTKLRKINRNYPWSMPDWLKIVLMITSTIIGVVFIVIMIYLRSTGNCMLSRKHLDKRRKSKSISQHSHDKSIELKELNCPQKSTVLRPLFSTSTSKSLKSVAKENYSNCQIHPRTSPDSPLLQYYQVQDKESIGNL